MIPFNLAIIDILDIFTPSINKSIWEFKVFQKLVFFEYR